MLEFIDISKKYKEEAWVLHQVSFSLQQGEVLSLAGESGVGKTTILNIISGGLAWDKGKVLVDGVYLTQPSERLLHTIDSVSIVYQDFKLDPYKTVYEHAAYPFRYLVEKEQQEATLDLLELLELGKLSDRKIKTLSGGQKQRLAIAGALGEDKPIILLDEPFSQLDHGMKERMLLNIKDYINQKGRSAIFVLHQPQDALSISDRIAVLHKGKMVQVGSPQDLYHSPVNAYVAALFGICNFIPTNKGVLVVRPEQISLGKSSQSKEKELAIIKRVVFKGGRYAVYLQAKHGIVVAETATDGHKVGEIVSLSYPKSKVKQLD